MTKTFRVWVHAILAILCFASVAGAQSVFLGSVLRDGEPSPALSGAEIFIPALNLTTRTDSLGRFLVQAIPQGTFRVIIRRLGYEEMAINARFSGKDTLAADLALTPISVSLDTVNIQGIAKQPGKFMAFEDRRTHGGGAFLSRADLEREKDHSLGEIVARLPGVRITRYGAEIAVATTRSSPTTRRGGDLRDRRRGVPRACYSQVYVDDVRVYSSEVGEALFNINSIPPATIQGIEYYASRDETPIQYASTRSECGTMLIWTRIE